MRAKIVAVLLAFCASIAPVNRQTEIFPVWASFTENDGVYARVSTEDKVIALTFDDGPHPYLTPKILDILEKYDAKATFFVVGKMAKTYNAALKEIASRGHEIGNHTFSHLPESSEKCEQLKKEILETEKIVFDLTGKKTAIFRPPTGYCCKSAVKMTTEIGYKTIVWDIDTRDWAKTPPNQILKTVQKYARSGSIILFHDFIGKDSPTPAALEIVLPYLKNQGFEFVTVSEMIEMKA